MRQRQTHGLHTMRRALAKLGTTKLDGRSALAVAIRQFKAEVAADLGGDLSRAQQTILEDAACTLIIRQSLDDYIARQPTLVTKKRSLLPIASERMRVAEHLAKQLDRLGLKRVPAPVESLESYLAKKAAAKAAQVNAQVNDVVPPPS